MAGLPANVWAASAASLLTDISSEMILNLIPLFLTNVLGARTGVVGLVEGVAETSSSLLKVFSGWLSDRVGTRKWLAVAGYAISTAAKPFLYIASTWTGVLGVRFAERIGKGVRTAPRDALIADSVDETQRGRAFGLHRAADTAGAMLGILVALLVVWMTQTDASRLSRATFQRLVLFSLIPAVLAVITLALGTRDIGSQTKSKAVPFLSGSLLDTRFKHFLGIIAVFTLGNSADAFLVLRAQEQGLSVLGILGMLATFNLVYAVVSVFAGLLSDRFGRPRLIVTGWLIYGVLYLGFAAAATSWQIWLLYALYGIYYGTVEGTARAYVAEIGRAHV